MSVINNVTSGNQAAIQQAQQAQQTQQNTQTQPSTNEQGQSQGNTIEVAQDTYAGSVPQVRTGNYNRNGYSVDFDRINAARAEMKNNVGAFKAMLNTSGTEDSGNVSLDANDPNYWGNWVQNQLGRQYSVEEAQSLVADDGYWGVEQTSQRIVDFAKSLAGDNMENYDTLMKAIEDGFGAAKDTWGGEMPDITSRTYDAVMEKMNAWREEASANAAAQGANPQASQGAQDAQNNQDPVQNNANQVQPGVSTTTAEAVAAVEGATNM